MTARFSTLKPGVAAVAVTALLLTGACAEDQARGEALSEAGSGSENDSSSTSSDENGSSSTSSSTSSSSTTSTPEATTSTTASTTTSSSTTATTTTTVVVVAAGLPTPDDVAQQYDALCLQTDSRDLAEKWFEPGVLDELQCRQDDGSGPQGRVETSFFGPCEAIPDAAGDASHRCFFYYEGGGYSLFVGDLGRGYRGLSVAFVVD